MPALTVGLAINARVSTLIVTCVIGDDTTREIDVIRQRVPTVDVAFLQMMLEEQMATGKGVP